MTSMTGYGHAEREDDSVQAGVEIRSVNNRFLDVNVSLPAILSPLEARVREVVGGRVRRGRVDVSIRIRDLAEAPEVTVDRPALDGYLRAIDELRAAAKLDEPVRLAHLIALDGVLRSERVQDREHYWATVEPLLEEALTGLVETRRLEGARLESDIAAQLARVKLAVDEIERHEGEIDLQIRANLKDRFRDVVGDRVEESRMLAEVAVQLTRFSINEEIVRLRAHLSSFEQASSGDEPVGKRLDFVCQELHREINTTGSKSIVLAVSEQVVEAKDALENIREQLRNVE